MTTLTEWAGKHGVTYAALHELTQMLIAPEQDPTPDAGESEAAVQVRVRLEASQKGCRLFRNNRGAFYDETQRFIRYGLMNESASQNKRIKSHDLIGIRPVMIQQHHVGHIFGQFLSREIKKASWRYSGNADEVAQLAWAELITSLGGDACFAHNTGTI